ncbi:hypothetical protein Taro_052118 [Colocasia esculenta]|uniref:Uncharacterized protein n=1 Tax=Colocasia esculenta TaxID=4460 RepID=A0A843XJA0_COLES|nr:hypothetical protein [Colocasia esculenta]
MGNCVRVQAVQPTSSWGNNDETWEWAEQNHRRRYFGGAEEGEFLKGDGMAAQPAATTEVRIKISKKQLQALLRNVEAQGLPLQLMLTHLVSGADGSALLDRGRAWRPALHSIPEVAE